MANTKILLGITGSIAAYKAAELVRLMKKESWDVSVIMTRSATQFVGKITLQTLSRNPVATDMFEETTEWRPEHISLGESADVLVIAPCTANVIAKLATGLADDMLTSTALACKAPLVIAPAMNSNMLSHPATQQNIKTLVSRGATIIESDTGELACGYSDKGRMAEPIDIIPAIKKLL